MPETTKPYLFQEYHESPTGERTLRDESISLYVPSQMPSHFAKLATGEATHRAALAEDGGDSLGFEVLTVTELPDDIPAAYAHIHRNTPQNKLLRVGDWYGVQYVDPDAGIRLRRWQYHGVCYNQTASTINLVFLDDAGREEYLPVSRDVKVFNQYHQSVKNRAYLWQFGDPDFPTAEFCQVQRAVEAAHYEVVAL